MVERNVEHGKTLDTVGMIERHAIRHARTAIMAANKEALKALCLHHLH